MWHQIFIIIMKWMLPDDHNFTPTLRKTAYIQKQEDCTYSPFLLVLHMCLTHVTAGSGCCKDLAGRSACLVSNVKADGELAESPVSTEEVQVMPCDAKLLRAGGLLFLRHYGHLCLGRTGISSGSSPALYKRGETSLSHCIMYSQ